ncbi:MAG TPA: VPLPA-CTERM sorting domain-containing protein, partial [Gammaproteobacteria bacterium]|nr:VPLPA-CTERM sorting domain-containing protein [Gammaproteobacteria bacterium]
GTEWVDGKNSGAYGGNNGGDLGNAHIPLTITFSNNTHETLPLNYVNSSLSSLTLTAPAAVPLPGAVWLFGSGLVGLAGFARRRGK